MAATKPGDLLTFEQVAEILGVKVISIRNGWLGINRIPKIRVGRLIRFRRSDVERFLVENTYEPHRNIEAARRSA